MKRSTTLLATVAILAFAAAAPAAGIEWGYSVDRDRPAVEADVPGTGGITLTNELFRKAAGNSDTVLTSLSTFSSASFEKPDTFTNAAYNLSVTLMDIASGATGSVTFSGQFNGVLSRSFAQIGNEFTGKTEYDLKLGNTLFNIRLTSYVPPPVPGASNTGSIGAFVTVREANGNPPPNDPPSDVPEPSTLLLAGLGLSCLGFSSVRKWRAKA